MSDSATVGRGAAGFTLAGHDGREVSLASLRGRQVVLVFVPSPWTDEGESLVSALGARASAWADSGTKTLAVCVEGLPSLRAWATSMGGVDFPLLSDFWPHGAVAERWGVLEGNGMPRGALFLVDSGGAVRYRGVGDPAGRLEDPAFEAAMRGEDLPAGERPAGCPMTMYASTWCPDCRRAREWLRKQGMPCQEIDIYADDEAAARVRGWAAGKMVVPTFDVGGEVLVGFRPRELARLLKKKTGSGIRRIPS